MVTLADALAMLFPGATPERDYALTDDGTGPRITAWHLPDPEPTPEQIAAVTPEQVAAARLARASVAAVQWFAQSMDPVAVALRVIIRDVYTRLNDLRELHGLDRTQEPDHVARLVGLAEAGYGAPIDVG